MWIDVHEIDFSPQIDDERTKTNKKHRPLRLGFGFFLFTRENENHSRHTEEKTNIFKVLGNRKVMWRRPSKFVLCCVSGFKCCQIFYELEYVGFVFWFGRDFFRILLLIFCTICHRKKCTLFKNCVQKKTAKTFSIRSVVRTKVLSLKYFYAKILRKFMVCLSGSRDKHKCFE